MTDASATPDPSDRPQTDDGGSAVPSESSDVSPGATPETETAAAAGESLEGAEESAGEAAEEPVADDAPTDGIVVSDGDVVTGDDADASDADDGADEDDDDGDDDEDAADGDADDDNPLDTEGEIAADYLEELLDIADLDGDIDTYVESERAHVSIVTEAEMLVGSNGEVLEALQELSRLAVMTETGHRSRLMLDVAGYRDRRRKVLAGLATEAVAEVRRSGESVRLAPMNPFERKIVHDAVAAGGLTSESEGEEPSRRVVVLPGS